MCPQENILYDLLTVRDHFNLFADIRNEKGDNSATEITQLLNDLDLTEYADTLAKNLSGGNKRKLQVGLAFVGKKSKLILLDEPTAGLDIAARRKMWDMLKQYKRDRIIILTTHYMDEAEVLGDRIGIMAQGKLVCLGSQLFLTSRYGVGDNLIIQQSAGADMDAMVEKFKASNMQLISVEKASKAAGDGKHAKYNSLEEEQQITEIVMSFPEKQDHEA